MTHLIFRDKATADAILQEIAVTPDIEGGIGGVWVWFDPDSNTNGIAYGEVDGKPAIAHPWSEVETAWLETYLAASITTGDVEIRDLTMLVLESV